MHGQGKFTWGDGSVYEGQWEEDKVLGKGKYILAGDSENNGLEVDN